MFNQIDGLLKLISMSDDDTISVVASQYSALLGLNASNYSANRRYY